MTDDVIGDLIPDGSGAVWAMGFPPLGRVGGQNDPSVPNREAGLVLLYGSQP